MYTCVYIYIYKLIELNPELPKHWDMRMYPSNSEVSLKSG